MTSHSQVDKRLISRRAILKAFRFAPLLFRAAPLCAFAHSNEPVAGAIQHGELFPFSEIRLKPNYPSPSPLADVLALVDPGTDEYITEKYALEIETVLKQWGEALKAPTGNNSALASALNTTLEATPLIAVKETTVRSAQGFNVLRREFGPDRVAGRERFVASVVEWLGQATRVETAEFEIFDIEELGANPLSVRTDVRYDIVCSRGHDQREERVGSWRIEWSYNESSRWKAVRWDAGEETVCAASGPVFIDITAEALGAVESYQKQMLHGADYWRTILDGAVGIDVYGNNGVAAGDFDNDGFDDLYVSQPAGLPNRLYRNRGDGTFEDVTEKAGVGVLDNTACAMFADFKNRGRQDLLVVCGTGPLLFLNKGDGTFSLQRDAFKFARPPQGTFTHAAVADYDRDGHLDIYFCMYMYYLGLDQYHYPIPYYDARNGPPNCLFHNQGDGTFVETTEAAGLNADNDRYSFACAWGDSNSNGLPDLFVANDFGSSQLYRNNGDGTFKVVSKEAHVESVGAGMSCCWADYDNDGHQDIYVPSMWEAAGQRVSKQRQFHEHAPERIRELYQRHARGNALYRNQGDGTFQNAGQRAKVEMGRWSWCSDFWDFDHDGYSDLYVSNGYLSSPQKNDLAGFFWRQVVARSSEDTTPSLPYERGWQAINELVRSDNTWHGYARNVMFVNNRDGSFSEAAGAVALDFREDSRSFALADIDHDGRLEVILKNRNAPQLRILHNGMSDIGDSISFKLRGTKSNRDAIGSAIFVEAGSLTQTKYLQAGSGFLAQHSKELFFGVGKIRGECRATVRWPSGLSQVFEHLPVNHRIEIVEGTAAFAATPFGAAPPAKSHAESAPSEDSLPVELETWLIEPLKAPAFAMPDLAGNTHQLASSGENLTLLFFWSIKAPYSLSSLDALKQFDRRGSALAASQLRILTINVDLPEIARETRTFAAEKGFPFPVILASEEVKGVYNLLYKHLYDRRRDLPIPIALLLNRDGMVVKVYQGSLNCGHLSADIKSIPTSADARMLKALPFRGLLVQDAFARNDFTYGVAMYQHGYLNQAAESFQQVIAAKPDSSDAYYNLGTLNLQIHNFEQARGYLEKTLKLQPAYPEAWNNLGMISAQQGHPDEAIYDFQKSLTLRPNYAIASVNLGNIYRRQKEFGKALEYLNRAFALQPDDPETNYSLGMLYAEQNQMQKAADYLQRAIDLRPGYPEALNNLGVLFVRQQNYAKAEEQFRFGMKVAPKFDQSYLNLARLYAMQKDKEKAKEVLQDLLRMEPENQNARQAMEVLQSAP